MTMSKPHIIKVLNKPYEIKCSAQEVENLQQAADKLNSHLAQTKKKFKHLSEFQTLLLSALNMSHELIACQKQQDQQRQQVSQFVSQFVSSLESSIQELGHVSMEREC